MNATFQFNSENMVIAEKPFKELLSVGFRVKVSVRPGVFGYIRITTFQTLRSEGGVIADQIRCRNKK